MNSLLAIRMGIILVDNGFRIISNFIGILIIFIGTDGERIFLFEDDENFHSFSLGDDEALPIINTSVEEGRISPDDSEVFSLLQFIRAVAVAETDSDHAQVSVIKVVVEEPKAIGLTRNESRKWEGRFQVR
jgi:hypothetical protein